MDKRKPVILDTDIGLDIDDTWALAFLLNSPEFDVKLISTVFGDTGAKAALTAGLLRDMGRTDIPIGIGIGSDMGLSPQMSLTDGFDPCSYPGVIIEDGIGAMANIIMASEEPVTIIAIGPASNLAACAALEPQVTERSSIVGMYGSIRAGYGMGSEPSRECNVVCDIPAFRDVLRTDWPMLITPLDSCGSLRLEGEGYSKFLQAAAKGAPHAKAVLAHYLAFLGQGDSPVMSTILYDVVAVYLAMNEDAFVFEDMRLSVTDDGLTVEDPAGAAVRVATGWAGEERELVDLLLDRLGWHCH